MSALPEARRPLRLSPGLGAIVRKDLADLLVSWRFGILAALMAVACLAALYVAWATIRGVVGKGAVDFVFLRLFTTSDGTLPPFTAFVGFLGPLLGLALGFDAICGEHTRRTLSRVLSQPVHRDAILNGKFLAGFFTITLMLTALGLVVAGLGLSLIGVPPTGEEVARILIFLVVTVLYVGFWLNLSILFSTLFRHAATAALASVAPSGSFSPCSPTCWHNWWQEGWPRPEPKQRRQSCCATSSCARSWQGCRLVPSTTRRLSSCSHLRCAPRGPVLIERLIGVIPGQLSLGQSLLVIWPHLVGLLALTLACFAVAYIVFMRREIRA